MIVSRMFGGIGNMMFQYAIGRNIAEKNNDIMFLDITWLNRYKKHGGYNLNNLNIKMDKIFNGDLKKIKKIDEINENFDEKILLLKGDIYLVGYWQSEKYFKEIENKIREEFVIKKKFITSILSEINNNESVSIHVRRGDYLTMPAQNFHICKIDYYKNAIDLIKEKHNNIKIYVFSDDIEWCKDNLIFDNINFIEGNKPWEDMYLMSCCKHNIIANSSFSWWSAWLNNNKDKIIVSPLKWFTNNTDTKDLIPEGWIKI